MMPALTLNPGFVLLLAAFVSLAAPRGFRPPLIVAAAIGALWLLLDYEFGAAAAMAQMGLPVVLLNIDALNRIFGIALIIALVAIGICTGGRRSRFEDAGILTLSGAVMSALFVGDLVSFAGSMSLAGLAAAWIVFVSPLGGANRAGVRMLVWQGLEGLLFLVGIAFHLSAGAAGSVMSQMDVRTVGGAFVFAALLIRVGAPFAHVWIRDVVSHASPAGGAALSAFAPWLGVYALARLFPAEPLLTPIGVVMILACAVFAVTEADLRRAGAYAMTMQIGVCVTLIGVGTPLALAAAEGHAFAVILGFVALQLALGVLVHRLGSAFKANIAGAARALPLTALLLICAGLAVSAAPGFALYATHAVVIEALSQWQLRWIWLIAWGTPALTFAGLALRMVLAIYAPSDLRPAPGETPFPMLLGAGLALFFCISVGVAPRWLYGLMPAELTFQAFALDRLGPAAQLLGAAGVVYLLAPRAPATRSTHLLDVDSFYRGPLTALARGVGAVALRAVDNWRKLTSGLASALARNLETAIALCDRPYKPGSHVAVELAAISALLALSMLMR
jgi:multicomponent Na+:H+ antiporter subunit D